MVAVEETGQTPPTSCLCMELDVHCMEYSCCPAWVTSSGSAPPQCYLPPTDGQLENLLSPLATAKFLHSFHTESQTLENYIKNTLTLSLSAVLLFSD